MGDPVRILSAGSLRHAMPEIVDVFSQSTGVAVSVVLGPAGLLRERIEAGEPFDLFASANMAHPQRLVSIGLADDVVCFAKNKLCIVARADLGLTSENLVEILSDPATKIGTSTPGDDPSGDYAFEMFDRIEARQPGAGEVLKSRARQLVGGRHSPAGRSTAGLIVEGEADLFIGYASNARLQQRDLALSVVEVPPEFQPDIAYGLALSKGATDATRRFRSFLMSNQAERILTRNGFFPRK
jgi:molybdate transport system substrate-binding protein